MLQDSQMHCCMLKISEKERKKKYQDWQMPRNCKNLLQHFLSYASLFPFSTCISFSRGCLFLLTASPLIQSTKMQILKSTLTSLLPLPLFCCLKYLSSSIHSLLHCRIIILKYGSPAAARKWGTVEV